MLVFQCVLAESYEEFLLKIEGICQLFGWMFLQMVAEEMSKEHSSARGDASDTIFNVEEPLESAKMSE